MANNKDFEELFVEQLKDMVSAEEQLVDALPKMAQAARSPKLKEAFTNHLKETKQQVTRLKKVFQKLNIPFEAEECEAMKGLIEEGEEAIKNFGKSEVIDPALIAAAQRVEHYEMAAYGTIRTFAKELGYDDIVDILQESLDEEGNANKLLTKIAEGGLFTSGVNQKAIKK